MDENAQSLGKKLKGLRLFYLILGVISIVYGFLGLWVTLGYSTLNPYSFQIPVDILLLTVFHLLAGSLLVITYYELLKSIKFGRFTGVIGCLFLLAFPLYEWIIYSFTFNFFFLLYIADAVLLLVTLLFWKRIPRDRNFEIKSKTKKIIAMAVIGIIVIGILIVVVPPIQKNFILGQLKYADYTKGFGFNPPEGWNVSTERPYVYCYPSIGNNASDKVSLTIGGYIGSIRNTPISIEKVKESSLDELSYWPNSTVNFSLISQNERTINGMDAYEFVYSYEEKLGNSTGPKIMEKRVLIVKNTLSWIVKYRALESLYSTYKTVVEQSINSIIII